MRSLETGLRHKQKPLLAAVRRFRQEGSVKPGVYNPHREAFRKAVPQLGEAGGKKALRELSSLLEVLPKSQLATDSLTDYKAWAGDIPGRQPETYDSYFFDHLSIPNPDYEITQSAMLAIQARIREYR